MKRIIMVVMCLICGVAKAVTPQIRNVKAFQQYPWGGKIYISYEVFGDVPTNAFPVIVAKDKDLGLSYKATALSGDLGIENGRHRLIWDVMAQGLLIDSSKVSFSVEIHVPDYLIIDLSGGKDATSYPVTYMCEPPSGGFNVEAYKTTKLVLRCIEPGSFVMGYRDSEVNPLHAVTITKPFYCGIFEMTQKQYELVTGRNDTGWDAEDPHVIFDHSTHIGDTLPMMGFAWYNRIRGSLKGTKWPLTSEVDSTSFMGKLRARTGLNFDLPTEAQWEYACRGRTTSLYNNGGNTEDDLKLLGFYSGNGGGNGYAVVGSYEPNAYGLYDMHGNVSEWCLDWYSNILPNNVIDPQGPTSGTHRVVRGGSGGDSASGCTSFSRSSYEPSLLPQSAIGFRLVLTLGN